MNAIPRCLSLEIRTADGLLTEFYQSDPKLIHETLRLLRTPRLFTQPQIFLASDHGTSAFTARSIDVIIARTDAAIQGFLPLNSPAGPVHIFESEAVFPTANSGMPAEDAEVKEDQPRILHAQVHTLGGWSAGLEVRAKILGTAQDRRRTFANFFAVPVIPFHLETGGIGLINPANLTRTSACPSYQDQPETALPMNLAGRASLRSEISANVCGLAK